MKRFCVYCGSNLGTKADYKSAADELTKALVGHNIGLVYGGGSIGIMGVVADAMLAKGGEVIGIIPKALDEREVGHKGLTELVVVNSMHERKAMMADLADGFIALPGGMGTLEELFEVLTWAQLGIHSKPCGLLNVAGYYDHLVTFLDHTMNEAFVRPEHRNMLLVDIDVNKLVTSMLHYDVPVVEKWITKEET